MRETKRHVITLSFTTLLLLLLLTSYLGVAYENLTSMTQDYQQSLASLQETEWTYISSIISEDQSKAMIQTNFVKDNIQKDLLNAYAGNMNKLKYDMDHPDINSTYCKILSQDINGKYINVDNDNNDMFVAELNIPSMNPKYPNFTIISDHSFNCSSAGIRNAQKELVMHANPALGLDAVQRMTNQDTTSIIFWEFLKSNNPNHYKIQYDSLSELKKVFMSEGVTGLSTYEICNVAYINSDKTDIFGTADIDNLGEKTNNYKIVVYQGFSITDDLNTNHAVDIQYFNNSSSIITQKYEDQKLKYTIEVLLVAMIMFIVFITLVKIQNLMLELEIETNKEN